MKKLSCCLSSLLVAGMALTGSAFGKYHEEAQVLNLCTGSSKGTYHKVGLFMKNQLEPEFIVNLVSTNGSIQNAKFIKNGTCDAAIMQSDAGLYYEDIAEEVMIRNLTEQGLFKEHVQLFCNRQVGGSFKKEVNDIEDLLDIANEAKKNSSLKTPIIYTGGKGSGAQHSLKTWQRLNKDYDALIGESVKPTKSEMKSHFKSRATRRAARELGVDVKDIPIDLNQLAMKRVKSKKGTNTCMLYISRVPVDWISKIAGDGVDDKGEPAKGYKSYWSNIKMLEVNDSDFDKETYVLNKKKHKVYFFEDIGDDTYVRLRKNNPFKDGLFTRGDKDKETLTVAANIYIAEDLMSDLEENDEELVEILEEAVANAIKRNGQFSGIE